MSASARRSTLIYGSVLVLTLGIAGALFVAFHGHNSTNSPSAVLPPLGETTAPTPRFAFDLKSVRPIATGKTKGVKRSAREAARNVRQTLDDLYVTAFLDPNAWETGSYGGVWRLFTNDAVTTARGDTRTLTLGSRAGSLFESVQPHAGSLSVRVLMDRLGHPSTAVAIVAFSARGTEQNGTPATIKSAGQFFLRPRTNGWAIYGYQVSRQDDPPGQSGEGTTP